MSPFDVLIEANFGDGMFTQLFKPALARFRDRMMDEEHRRFAQHLLSRTPAGPRFAHVVGH